MEAKVIDELLKRARRVEPQLCADRERYVAEISFRAGEQLSLEKQGQAFLEGKQAGIREVVEWIEDNNIFGYIGNPNNKDIENWQAQKKRWGIEKNEKV